MGHDAEGGYVACDSASAFDECPVADVGVFVDEYAGGEDGAFADFDVACDCDVVADDVFSFEVCVVSDVGVCH